MCFSTEASLAASVALLPAGGYCVVVVALGRDRRYLPLAFIPFLFSAQQLFEAGVWRGLHADDPGLLKVSSLAFLFFAIGFWPGWVPLAAGTLEDRPAKRRSLFALAALGFVAGFACYLPAAWHYGDWLEVRIVDHSIRYDLGGMPGAQSAAGTVWQVVYLATVCLPFLLSRDSRLRILGLLIAGSAATTQAAFRYQFISVWCFCSALLSLYIGYVLCRLPVRSNLPRSATAVG